jgi:menaquinone-dependent protoporphyrinogen oxidase
MKILIAYTSTEGQTRKIARYSADFLVEQGHSVEICPAEDAEDTSLSRFDAVLLAGSVHAGRYQGALLELAKAQSGALAKGKAAFLSVSLAAAGDDPDDWAGLRKCVERFADDTGWTPQTVIHVAGAFRFSEYDFFKSWAMRWIARDKDQTVKPGEDKEYTDWAALKTALGDWLGAA